MSIYLNQKRADEMSVLLKEKLKAFDAKSFRKSLQDEMEAIFKLHGGKEADVAHNVCLMSEFLFFAAIAASNAAMQMAGAESDPVEGQKWLQYFEGYAQQRLKKEFAETVLHSLISLFDSLTGGAK